MLTAVRVAACLAVLASASQAHAQTYPNGNVKIVVPYPAGGPTDVMARLLAQKLSTHSDNSSTWRPRRGERHHRYGAQ